MSVNSIPLKGGNITSDVRLDRVTQFDERSRSYPVRAALQGVQRKEKRWTPGDVLDQGSEGACVGFGWSGELEASPVRVKNVDNSFARALYHRAQQLDEWPGEEYEGTSVLAGAKACKELGMIESYRWAFGIDDLIDAVVGLGPAVLGINWYEGMYETRPSGLVEVTGNTVGGHCILITGYHPKMRIRGEGWLTRHEVLIWQNSWGTGYGRNGFGYVPVEGMEALLKDAGEACVPLSRFNRSPR